MRGVHRSATMKNVRLPVMPPVAPMLAKSVPRIPSGALSFEPKWDGFRSIIFRDGDEVEIGSRNGLPMTRYFPEIVEAVKANLPERSVIDGEIVVVVGDRLEFEVLQQRIHPATSRVNRLANETPASFIAFDILASGDEDYTTRPFAERRALLVAALANARPPIHLTPPIPRAPPPLGGGAGQRPPADPPHPGHHRPRRGGKVVRAVRRRWPRRGRGQTSRGHVRAEQTGDVQDQTHPHRRLRRRRLPRPCHR